MRLVISCCALLGIFLALDSVRQRHIREERQAALAALSACDGFDISKLSEPQLANLTKHISKLVPQRTYDEPLGFDFAPDRVWTTPGSERPVCLLFETRRFIPHPGSTPIRITVFDHLGNTVSETTFTTGHRCYMQEVRFEPLPGSDSPLVIVNTTEAGLGPDVARQFYAPIDGQYELIRLENEDGNVSRNRYYVRHFMCGPAVPRQSDADWAGDLLSADRNRSLRALVWLGGVHRTANPKTGPNETESLAELQSVQRVRANPRVVERLKELSRSEDRWLREAAILAANPEDARW
jgi:hypothetical protein